MQEAGNLCIFLEVRPLLLCRREGFHVPFLIRLTHGKTLMLEIRGEDGEQNRAKLAAIRAWVDAVNGKGGF